MMTNTMTKAARKEILIAARGAAARGEHEIAAGLFALVGISYVPAMYA